MDYKDKYLKYKKMYLELKNITDIKLAQVGGGEKYDFENKMKQILSFIKKSNKNKIKEKLFDIIQYGYFCPIILGEGFAGRTYIPEVNKTISFNMENKKIDLPVIVKDSKNDANQDAYFGTNIFDSKLYINAYGDITTEAIILMYVRKLWNQTVHLPLILGYGTCSKKNIINKIISLKYGLDEPIEIYLQGKIFNEEQMWYKPEREPKTTFSSNIATLRELFTFIHYSKNPDGSVLLPNGIKCDNISELFDYMCISYLATHELLTKNNIYPSDMHSSNIFIHWLNDSSYYNETNIKNIKEIVYKVGNKYYKIKTFGFVIILGDTGTFFMNAKKDVIIAGQIWDIKQNYKLIKKRMCSEYSAADFILWNYNFLPPRYNNKTIAYKILNHSEPYCSYPSKTGGLLGWDIAYLDKLKTGYKLLEFYYEKYGVKKYTKNKDNILITI